MEATVIRRTVEMLGGPSATARLCGVTPAAVQQWMGGLPNHTRPVPLDKRVLFERETGGRIRVEDFGDDVVWARTPDPSWPHPLGRPVHDVLSTADRKRAAEAVAPSSPLGLAA